ncbi:MULTISPECIES: hypothetical protein [Pseudanabaena]|uniref:Uncharacterized protein n=2 Tax=Pseudanabaena TaxID=1152 RepID=L8MWX8_9CYAN|nr:hypothetical protein [Pseudanabaena catenata]ELS30975.1 hypothetical protein Pse7429DRAFT_3870 [Pseudanabaena biceps PCC 7429]MDG3496753.1 hypothetical protein [Pseudanabaena catenata USMAC16]
MMDIGDRAIQTFAYNVTIAAQNNPTQMAQLTIDIPDELAQRLAPYQNQISEIFARLINTSLLNESTSSTELVSNPLSTDFPTYLEIIDFLVNRPTSEQIANFKVSERSQTRLQELLQKNRDSNLLPSEVAELNLYEQLDVLMTMLKIRSYASIRTQNPSISHSA